MKGPQKLRKPANWQDFETLCKKLWGEIWKCPDIKKNGRSGQSQQGVDIYCIPKGEDGYFGIQCKGKDEYTEKQFTKAEITKEIENAKRFKPQLKKLYFATTALKDAVMEEFVRTKNLENKSKGLFEVDIFSWEDIVELIDQYRETHDWYVNSQNYKSNKSVQLTFDNDSTEIILRPQFRKLYTAFSQKMVFADPYQNPLYFFKQQITTETKERKKPHPYLSRTVNLSFCEFKLKLTNTGTNPIENWKVLFRFEGNVSRISNTNESDQFSYSELKIDPNDNTGIIEPKKTVFVGNDVYISKPIFIKPEPQDYEILLKWDLVSKDFKDQGNLRIVINCDLQTEHKTVLEIDPLEARKPPIEGPIEDYIIEKEE